MFMIRTCKKSCCCRNFPICRINKDKPFEEIVHFIWRSKKQFTAVFPKITHVPVWPSSPTPVLLQTCSVEAGQSLNQCGLQNLQQGQRVPVPVLVLWAPAGAEQLLIYAPQQQSVEVLPAQEQVHVLEEKAFTEPAKLVRSETLRSKQEVETV